MEVENMNDDVYAFALKNTLDEIQNICPDIRNAFIFKEDGEIIAGDMNTPEKNIVRVVNAFDGIFEKAESLNGVESITLEGSKGKLVVSCVNDLYLVTVTSKEADMKYVNTVTRVLIPTILKLVEKFNPASLKNDLSQAEAEPETIPKSLAFGIERSTEESDEQQLLSEKTRERFEPEVKPEPILPEPPVNQLIVENLGGLLVPSDTVRVDNATLTQWTELYEGRKIGEVEIETFDGKTIRCKVKPIKESKHEGKGIVQMPEKVQLKLEIRKGELVRIKPIVEQ
jgi:predicted regulator of Ras-like GTPase activity (Roadblock/LC7/MglB family)